MLVHLAVSDALLSGSSRSIARRTAPGAPPPAAGRLSVVLAAARGDTTPPRPAAQRDSIAPPARPTSSPRPARTSEPWTTVQAGAPRGGPHDDGSLAPATSWTTFGAPLVRAEAVQSSFVPRRLAKAATVAPVAIPIADSLVLRKHAHVLVLYERGVPLRSYQVALGRQPAGDKEYLGDNRTPEGVFRIAERNPNSRYHLALRLSYPDSAHRARAAAVGRSPGGDIMIHGLPDAFANVGAAHREEDWTEGCIAVTNAEIEEIWRLVPVGAPIQIQP